MLLGGLSQKTVLDTLRTEGDESVELDNLLQPRVRRHKEAQEEKLAEKWSEPESYVPLGEDTFHSAET
ncbi:MAG: hypothetical protein PWR29_1029 [Methanolobus sp.]|jgi:hypothetical protein|nr:hypothetical protein [Methanolobus sp.]MDK2835060.1 hypothetical protein [Methanolobus sp.]MDK2912072.1 hypothetical protein [Methanolobus sp.]MDN5309244.1 hypothetical protein [Methanolobus sp.]